MSTAQADTEKNRLAGKDGITMAEAQARLHLTDKEVREWIKGGILPVVKVRGEWRIPLAGVVKPWLYELEDAVSDVEIMFREIVPSAVAGHGFPRPWPPDIDAEGLDRLRNLAVQLRDLTTQVDGAWHDAVVRHMRSRATPGDPARNGRGG
jgi:hypothetical protein